MPVVRLAPAKINLTLAVVGPRDDGYHDLHSVFVPLGLHDRLSLAVAGAGARGDTLHVDGLDTGPTADDLVLRGIAAARAAVGQGPGRPATPPLAARLEKRIPVAAGLGGGSSDAAAALDGALEAWGVTDEHVDLARRQRAAASLGSDVPFFLTARPALIEGRGDRVRPLGPIRGEIGVLLVTPRIALRTPEAFAVFAATRGRGDGAVRQTSEHLAAELERGIAAHDLLVRAGVLASANDLAGAAAVIEPGLVPLKRALLRALGRPVGLSGSGPTFWTLYPSESDAREAAATLAAAVEAGTVPIVGDGPPTVIPTTIRSQEEP